MKGLGKRKGSELGDGYDEGEKKKVEGREKSWGSGGGRGRERV